MSRHSPHTVARYDRASIALHWITLALVILAFASIEMRVLFERGTPARLAAKEWHYVIGLAILAVTLARLLNRARRPSPPEHPPLPAWAAIPARLMHWALYAALIALPVTGALTVNSLGDALHLGFGITLPPVLAVNEPVGEWLEDAHSLVGDTLYVLIGLHATAALLHHFVLKDATLRRMLPERARKAAPSKAKAGRPMAGR